MVPKKTKDFIAPTAEATGVSEDLVKDLVGFYWGEVRKALVDMKGPIIVVEAIGTFQVKHWKIPELIAKYDKYLAKYKGLAQENKLDFRQFAIQKEIELKKEKAVKLKEMVDIDAERKKLVKQKRDEYISKNQTNLPEQEEDI